jgi:hypothetical protein
VSEIETGALAERRPRSVKASAPTVLGTELSGTSDALARVEAAAFSPPPGSVGGTDPERPPQAARDRVRTKTDPSTRV